MLIKVCSKLTDMSDFREVDGATVVGKGCYYTLVVCIFERKSRGVCKNASRKIMYKTWLMNDQHAKPFLKDLREPSC